MKEKRISISADNTATIIIVLYFIAYLINQNLDNFIGEIPFLLGISGLLFLFNFREGNARITNVKMILWFVFLYFFIILSTLYTKNIGIGGVMLSLQYVGITVLLVKYNLNSKIVLFSFYIHALYFGFHMIEGSNPNTIFSSSRNYVSVIMLVQSALVYISLYKSNKSMSYMPALITLIISIWAIGRSGILSSAFLMTGIIFTTIRLENRKRNITLSIILVFLISLLFIIPDSELKIVESLSMNYEMAYERIIDEGIEERGRGSIISEYINQMGNNISNLFFGVPFKSHPIFMLYNNNLHNSFIQAHAYFGLVGILIIILNIFVAVVIYLKQKNILFLFIFGSLLLRASTDTIAFFGIVDPLLYFFLIYAISSRFVKKPLSV